MPDPLLLTVLSCPFYVVTLVRPIGRRSPGGYQVTAGDGAS